MKYLFVILLFISIGALAQKPREKELIQASSDFHKALVYRDSVLLKKLMCERVDYGHSNGWVQTKEQVIADLFNGKLAYQEIRSLGLSIYECDIEGKTGWVRSYNVSVKATMDGKPIELKLDILTVWIWKDKRWQLFARQSVKK